MTNILVIPDTHFPFQHKDTFKFLAEMKRRYRPDMVFHDGDIIDGHTLGRWDPDADAKGAADEIEAAQDALQHLAQLFPMVHICYGNHDLRAFKKLTSARIPTVFMRSLPEVLGTPKNWKWADYFLVQAGNQVVRITHGDGFTGAYAALKAAQTYRQSTIIGHVHAFAGVQWTASPAGMIFGMNVGSLIDEEQYAFNYAKLAPNRPVSGCGVIMNGVPHFEPL